ncbi:UNVERIFIED_ORG: preprotein translocase subunit YajC [Heyndrickxia coagulans]
MENFFDYFLNVSVVLLIYVVLILLVNGWKSRKAYKDGKTQLEKLRNSIKVDDVVIFSGGIKGKVISINDIWVTVEVANGAQLEVLINSIMNVFQEK